ncbi:hypothetical protein VP01_684g1 [Puccinia sorghi]|uniref:Uncharacterized protein n=1 Tax=Puccinia sorghi TaxID=27349 RepID=A0A0L6UGJ5_9BASI|nr:hypothetical protein VP01_684g1 [Puccinia sorghi]
MSFGGGSFSPYMKGSSEVATNSCWLILLGVQPRVYIFYTGFVLPIFRIILLKWALPEAFSPYLPNPHPRASHLTDLIIVVSNPTFVSYRLSLKCCASTAFTHCFKMSDVTLVPGITVQEGRLSRVNIQAPADHARMHINLPPMIIGEPAATSCALEHTNKKCAFCDCMNHVSWNTKIIILGLIKSTHVMPLKLNNPPASQLLVLISWSLPCVLSDLENSVQILLSATGNYFKPLIFILFFHFFPFLFLILFLDFADAIKRFGLRPKFMEKRTEKEEFQGRRWKSLLLLVGCSKVVLANLEWFDASLKQLVSIATCLPEYICILVMILGGMALSLVLVVSRCKLFGSGGAVSIESRMSMCLLHVVSLHSVNKKSLLPPFAVCNPERDSEYSALSYLSLLYKTPALPLCPIEFPHMRNLPPLISTPRNTLIKPPLR